ncbi:transcriptional regulator [Paraburkholderia sp. DGU8]|uniref:transcriptional regulator n=1 Tax=Paraburkholderia sp. DGU8 TaxID=3161997 RepID=UPI003465149E
MVAKAASAQLSGGGHLSPSESLPLDGYSRWNDLKPFVPFCRETWRKRELAGKAPRRIHLSARCACWSNRELHRFFADPVNYKVEG